jgi:hypothetical protein
MKNQIHKDRRQYNDPEDDECPKQSRIDRLIDQADYLRDERRDREMDQRESERESKP